MSARPAAASKDGATPPRGLGKLVSEHRAPPSLKRVALLTAPLMLLLGVGSFAGAIDSDPQEPLAARVFLALVALCFAGLGAGVLVVWRIKRVTLVQLYEGGIVELVGAKRRELAWRDVRSFSRSMYSSALYGVSGLKIELRDGSRLKLNSQHLQGLEAIANRLEREVGASSLPEMRESLSLGRTLAFGKLTVSQQGIRYRRRILAWEELATAQLRLGFFEVLKHGDAAPSLRVRGTRLERVDSLLALVRDQRQRAALAPPFAVSRAWGQVRSKLWLQSVLLAPLVALFLWFGGYNLYHALRAVEALRAKPASAASYFAWAVLGSCLALFLGLGWWHDINVRLRRHGLARRLGMTGKLVPVLVLEKLFEQWSFHSGWRYRYLTPAGFEATDKIDGESGGPEPWANGSDYLLALCSPDERESVLVSASGYPLAGLPAPPDAS